MDFTFRKAVDDSDIKRIADCAVDVWHDTFDNLLACGQVDYMIEMFQSFEAIKNCIADNGYEYYIAESGKNIVGYCGVKPEPESQKLFISKIYVHPKFQRNGIATSFFNLLKTIYGNDFKTFYLTVNKHNDRAISVYKKWNFKIADSVVSDIGNGYVMDDYIMEYK